MVKAVDEQVEAGRQALHRNAWDEAFTAFREAAAIGQLEGDDLEALAEAARWSGEFTEHLNALERAYLAHLAAGNRGRAAYVALKLAVLYRGKQAQAVAAGWQARAEHLLKGEPESVYHGYLAEWQAVFCHGQGDPERARPLAERAVELAERYGDRDLWGLATHTIGQTLLAEGDAIQGLALIDEAAAAAVAGELSVEYTGLVYCWTISACRNMADVKRAVEWTEATARWCERQSVTGFPGICRLHRAEILRLRGAWADAEAEAARAAQELLEPSNVAAAPAYNEIGEIRMRIGDFAGAEEAFDQADTFGYVAEPGRSLLRFYRGDVRGALASIRRAVADQSSDRFARSRLLPAQVEIALAAGALDEARHGAEELESLFRDYGTTLFEAAAAQARGAVHLAEGDAESGLRTLRRAYRLWQELDAPYEAAQVRLLLGRALAGLGEHDAAATEARAAIRAFQRLGATPDAKRAEEQLAAIAAEAEPAPEPASRTMQAFLFSDIVKSTNLIEVIGDDAWESLVRWHDRTLRALFREHKGQEVEHRGDGFFVTFSDAQCALSCAVTVQRRLAEHRQEHGFAPRVRIGVHLAEAMRTGGTFSGKGVHAAARIGALADGNEILTSAETLAAAGDGFSASPPRTVALKGISDPVEICSIQW